MTMRPFILAITLTLLASCTKTVYVPTETTRVHTDTLLRSVYVDRTVIERDTINTYTSGDTVYRDRIRWRERTTVRHDTVYQAVADSIAEAKPYPVEVIKEVERDRRWWETALLWCGGAAIALLAFTAYKKLR